MLTTNNADPTAVRRHAWFGVVRELAARKRARVDHCS
jgi:hypothetical protein